MPLQEGYSDKTKSHNIAEMINSGYSLKQAAAAAYAKAREAKKAAGKNPESGDTAPPKEEKNG